MKIGLLAEVRCQCGRSQTVLAPLDVPPLYHKAQDHVSIQIDVNNVPGTITVLTVPRPSGWCTSTRFPFQWLCETCGRLES